MKSDDNMPMWDDPAESELVRDLLTAGRSADVDYDVTKGLQQHLAHIQAGAPLPKWAEAGGMGAASSGSLVTWVVVPVVTASVAAAVWFAARDTSPGEQASFKTTRPVAAEVASSAPVETALPVEPSLASPLASPLEPAAGQTAPEVTSPSSLRAERGAAARGGKTSFQRRSSGRHADRSVAAAPAVSARIPDELPLRVDSTASGSTSSTASSSMRSDVRATQSSAASSSREGTNETRPVVEATESKQETQAQKSESKLEREMQMLAVAQRVLTDDPARALRMAQQGEREFGDSMFSAERKNVEVLALVKLGRIDDARRVGKALLAKYPNAPFSQRLRKALVSGHVD